MNYLLHCHRSPGHIVPIPEGLTELMADISREVLRCQPSDVISFVADYLDGMLLTRENTIVAQKTVDDMLEHAVDVATFYKTTCMDSSRAKHVIDVFRKNLKEKEILEEDDQKFLVERLIGECRLKKDEAKKAAEIMREVQKIHEDESYEPELGPKTVWDPRVEKTLQIYEKSKPTKTEMNRAATCLQAVFRGYCQRKKLNKEKIKAATLIQSAFRGYQTRKSLQIPEDELCETFKELSIEKSDEVSLISSSDSSKFRAKTRWEDIALKVTSNLKETLSQTAAATTIQSIFRGNQTRKAIRRYSMCPSDLKPIHVDTNSEETEAATTIQSIFRGNQTRKAVSRYSWCPSDTKPIHIQKRSSKKTFKKSLSKESEPKLDDLLVIQPIKLTSRTSSTSLKHSHMSVVNAKKH